MFTNITRTTLCITAFSIASLMAAPLDATKTESLDWNWKFARFGKMPDGSTQPEPGKSMGFATATSEESGNPADNAVDGDKSTRWCADSGKSGEKITVDMGRPADVKTVNILWEKQSNHLFKLEGSGDGKRWTTIEDKTSGQNDSMEDTVENKTGKPRYFRITVTGNNQSNWASIREITFKNDKGEIIRPQAAAGTSKTDNPSSPSFNDKNWRSLNLPHDWGVEGPFRMEIENRTGKLPWVGIGWYRKTLEIPAEAKGNQFYLDFDGVMSRPKIYVNGHLAGEWKYGYSSFRVDITPFLEFGQKNTIAVRVDNPPSSSRWYPGGGIYRHVWLTESNPVHIEHWGVFVKTPEITKSAAKVEVDTTVKNTTEQPVTPTVTEEILDGNKVVASVTTKGEAIPAGEKGKVTSTLTLKNPTLWTLKAPHLYKMKTIVKVGDKIIDQKFTNFGVRTIEWKPTGFYLNGERVQLNGVCQHHDLGTGTQQALRMFERHVQAGLVPGRARIPARQRVEHAHGPAHAGRRRDRRLAAAQGRDAVAGLQRRPHGDRARTRGLHRLEAHARAEVQRRIGIGDQQGQPLALGLEQLGVGAAAARGQAPVHPAHVVTDGVLARFGVLHAAATQARRCRSMHAMAAPPWLRRTPHLGAKRHQFGQRRHDAWRYGIGRGRGRAAPAHGGGTRSSSAATRRSPSQPSASAS